MTSRNPGLPQHVFELGERSSCMLPNQSAKNVPHKETVQGKVGVNGGVFLVMHPAMRTRQGGCDYPRVALAIRPSYGRGTGLLGPSEPKACQAPSRAAPATGPLFSSERHSQAK